MTVRRTQIKAQGTDHLRFVPCVLLCSFRFFVFQQVRDIAVEDKADFCKEVGPALSIPAPSFVPQQAVDCVDKHIRMIPMDQMIGFQFNQPARIADQVNSPTRLLVGRRRQQNSIL